MEWVKTSDRLPTKDGRYYVKALFNNGEISKLLELYEDGKWKLGSGHLVIRLILEWLEEND